MEACPRRRDDVKVQVLDEETVILDQRLLQIHRLNDVAAHVWTACDGWQSPHAIALSIERQFEVDGETARRDVNVALRLLLGAGLLQSEPAKCHPATASKGRNHDVRRPGD